MFGSSSGIGRVVATMAVMGCLFADSSVAASAPPGALGPGRFIASPQGRVAWMDVSRERILLSDLGTGVAALDPDSGSILWSHAAARGRVTGVWSVGGFVVVASGTVEVLDARSGETVWRRDLFCASPTQCKERAVWAGPEGVLVSGTGSEHRELRVLDLLSSQEVWRTPAPVHDPIFVQLNGPSVVVLDGASPHYLRILDRATGTPSKPWSWSWREKGAPDGVDIIPDGQVLVRYAEQGRRLARVAVIAENGRELDRTTIDRPRDVHGSVYWAHLAGERLWLWGEGDAGNEGWVYHAKMGSDATAQPLKNVIMDQPLVLEQTLMLHQHDGRSMEIGGYDAATGRRRWSHRIDAPPRHGKWHEVDRVGLLVWEGRPAPVLLVDPFRGGLVAMGEISTAGREMVSARRSETTLYIAVHDGVFAHELVPMDQLRAGVLRALSERRIEDAEALYHPLALAADISDEVLTVATRLIRDTVIQARLQGRRDPANAMEPFIRGLSALDRGGGRTLASWSPHLGSVVGDLILGARKQPAPNTVELLVRLAMQLTSALERLGDAFDRGGRAEEDWVALRDALVVTSAALVRADRGPEAASLLDASLEWAPEHTPGLSQLRQAAAVSALFQVVVELTPALKDRRASIRDEAIEALRTDPYAEDALPGDLELIRRIRDGSFDGLSAGEGRRLAAELRRALDSARATLGSGLGEPGCILACDALARTCGNGCRRSSDCDSAGRRCRKECRDGEDLKWQPPRGIPKRAADVRACY